jgi:hypothetical protein
VSRGVEAVMADAASICVMIEGVGSRSARWMQIKREDFFLKEEERTGTKHLPPNIVRQPSHAVSSLSSSSGASNNGSSDARLIAASPATDKSMGDAKSDSGASVSKNSSSGSSNESLQNQQASGGFHDYHAQPLPDPKLADSERSSSSTSDDSPEDSNSILSGDDASMTSMTAINDSRSHKRRKGDDGQVLQVPPEAKTAAAAISSSSLPLNIAKKGGISHNIRPVLTNPSVARTENPRLSTAPLTALPPFTGIGKRSQLPVMPPAVTKSIDAALPSEPHALVVDSTRIGIPDRFPNTDPVKSGGVPTNVPALDGPDVIAGDVETSPNNSSQNRPQIRAYYHLNEDAMILMEDVLMCPFLFKTHDAVVGGALAECVMPGMLRANFSAKNKLASMEMVYDAMGFMQQLERASGSEVTAQIIPGSLEMALSPTASEARVITLAEPPFLIVNVNEVWTRMTKYSQMEVEGQELFGLLQGENSEGQPGIGAYNLDDMTQGRCTCSTRLHYDKEGREFVDFVSSYPLTKYVFIINVMIASFPSALFLTLTNSLLSNLQHKR